MLKLITLNCFACLLPLAICLEPVVLNSNKSHSSSTDQKYGNAQSLENPTAQPLKDSPVKSKLIDESLSKGSSYKSNQKYLSEQDNPQNVLSKNNAPRNTNSITTQKKREIAIKLQWQNYSRVLNQKRTSYPSKSRNRYSEQFMRQQRRENGRMRNQRNKYRRRNRQRTKRVHRQDIKQGERKTNKYRPYNGKMYEINNTIKTPGFSKHEPIIQDIPTKPTNCATCSNKRMSKQLLDQLHTEDFLNTLAKKLRTTPEKLMIRDGKGMPPELPPGLIIKTEKENRMLQRSHILAANEHKIILPGIDLGQENCDAEPTSACYGFDLKDKIKGKVTSAVLRQYKTADANDNRPQTFIVYGLEKLKRQGQVTTHNQLQRTETRTRKGWVAIDMTQSVSSWVVQREGSKMIAVRCVTCANSDYKSLYGVKENYKPLIIVKYNSPILPSRDRRSANDDHCDPSLRCCKQSLEINFQSLHMINIVSPPRMNVGYCNGTCESVTTNLATKHTELKQSYRLKSENITNDLFDKITPCCVPTQLLNTSVFVNNGSGSKLEILNNIIVNECGCA